MKTLPVLPQTLTICTDDVFPDDLVERGGMIDVLRRLVRYGMAPVDALRASTLNAAMRLGRRDLGLVAPGRRADLMILDDLAGMGVDHVYASGTCVAKAGALVGVLRADSVALPTGTVKVSVLHEDDFRLAVADATTVRLRTVVNPRFTEWGERMARVERGFVVLPEDTILMAVFHRHGRAPATPRLGILEGWSMWRGALATTVAHDSHNLVVFGRDPVDMMLAANAVIDAGGGMATAQSGQLTATLPLPVCGLISDAPTVDVADAFRKLKSAAEPLADWHGPYLVFKAVVGASLACNPGPHVTDLGITDGTTGAVFPSALIAAG